MIVLSALPVVNSATTMKRMKSTWIAITLLAGLQLVSAQERLERQEALEYACLVGADLTQLQGTPIPTDVDLKHPVALREGEYGGMVLPECKLSAEALAKAGRQPVPIGQLWLLNLTPMGDGEAVGREKLRLVTVRHRDGDVTVPQCALAVQQNGAGGLDLLVFGKEKEPVLKVGLKKIATRQELPIDLVADHTSAYSGSVTLRILGAFETTLTVTELSPY